MRPSINVAITGDTLTKIGEQITYTYTITNTSREDAPHLELDSIVGTFLSDLEEPQACRELAPNAFCDFSVGYTVRDGDPDPLVTTVTVAYHPFSFRPSHILASDRHAVQLFQPSVEVTSRGDTLSKVGDPVTYTFTITNRSSEDTPDLINGSITDTLLGDLLDPANSYVASSTCRSILPRAGSCEIHATWTPQIDEPDPLPGTVTVHYHPEGFPNDITNSDSHVVELFQPSLQVIRTGDTLAMVGDTVIYTFTINNLTDGDLTTPPFDGTAPNLILDDITDTLLDDTKLAAAAHMAFCDTLAVGGSCTFTLEHVVQPSNPDPLPSSTTVLYRPDGFPNAITDSSDHSVELFQPSVEVISGGDSQIQVWGTVTYEFTITNTSSGDTPDLVLDTISDTLLGDLSTEAIIAGCDVLSPNEVCTLSIDQIVGLERDPLENTVIVQYHPEGFTIGVSSSDTHSVVILEPPRQQGWPYVVRPNTKYGPKDTLQSIAEKFSPNDSTALMTRIAELNRHVLGLHSAPEDMDLYAGQVLLMPDIGFSYEYDVEPGDTLVEIVERYYGYQYQSALWWRQVCVYVQRNDNVQDCDTLDAEQHVLHLPRQPLLEETQIRARPDDNLSLISLAYYGNERMAQTIQQWNETKIPHKDFILTGLVIELREPPRLAEEWELTEALPQWTLEDWAWDCYANTELWWLIRLVNREILGDFFPEDRPLQVGQVIRLYACSR